MSAKRTFALFIALAMALTLFAGCGGSTPATSDAPASDAPASDAPASDGAVDKSAITGNVVFYTADPEEIATEVLEAFVAEYPNCTYTLNRNGTGKLTAAMTAELEAGGTECNCFSFSDLAYIYNLEKEGLLLHFTPEGAENLVDTTFGDMAYSYKLENCGIAYNKSLISDAPKDWFDLANPEYKDMVAFADPSYSGAALTTAVVHDYNGDVTGWDFYKAMKDNGLKFEQSNGNLQQKVSSGEYAAVVIVDYMARNSISEGAPIDFIYPESGGVIIYSPFAIMNTVKDEDKDAVLAFADFLLSDTAQAIFAKYNYLPGMKTATAPGGLDFNTIKFLNLDINYYLENVDQVRTTYEELFPAS